MPDLRCWCPACYRPVDVAPGQLGTRVICPHCANAFLAPLPSAASLSTLRATLLVTALLLGGLALMALHHFLQR